MGNRWFKIPIPVKFNWNHITYGLNTKVGYAFLIKSAALANNPLVNVSAYNTSGYNCPNLSWAPKNDGAVTTKAYSSGKTINIVIDNTP